MTPEEIEALNRHTEALNRHSAALGQNTAAIQRQMDTVRTDRALEGIRAQQRRLAERLKHPLLSKQQAVALYGKDRKTFEKHCAKHKFNPKRMIEPDIDKLKALNPKRTRPDQAAAITKMNKERKHY